MRASKPLECICHSLKILLSHVTTSPSLLNNETWGPVPSANTRFVNEAILGQPFAYTPAKHRSMSELSWVQLSLAESSKNAQLMALCVLINNYYSKVLNFRVACYTALANQHTYIVKRSTRHAPAGLTKEVQEPWPCFRIRRFCIRLGVRGIEEAYCALDKNSLHSSPLGKDERFSPLLAVSHKALSFSELQLSPLQTGRWVRGLMGGLNEMWNCF